MANGGCDSSMLLAAQAIQMSSRTANPITAAAACCKVGQAPVPSFVLGPAPGRVSSCAGVTGSRLLHKSKPSMQP
jgi:hypothetical protein